MKIDILKNPVEKNHFNLNLTNTSFVASPSGVFFNISKKELETLIAFASAELQEAELTNE